MAKPSGRRTSQFKLSQGQPQPSVPSLENTFVAGLKTEFTGLNFPEHACTATQNCTFTRVGNVTRRNGIDYESGFHTSAVNIANLAISTFIWTNAGGDGNTKIMVVQVGGSLNFYQISNATITNPLSTTLLGSSVQLNTFLPVGSSAVPSITECQYAAGNGYLFVFHPNLDPFYCTFNAGTITATLITIQQRDFVGILEPGVPDTFRAPAATESTEHAYNLQNQGWSNSAGFTAISNTFNNSELGLKTFTVQAGLSITLGTQISLTANFTTPGFANIYLSGNVISYSGTSLEVNVTASSNASLNTFNYWTFASINTSLVLTWIGALGTVPSNSDVWWTFKNSSNVFDPATEISNVTLSTPAPKGFYILNAFNQDRANVSGISPNLLTKISTNVRPRTGTWFAGRVWYTGVDASFPITGDAQYTTWTENIYYSQIVDGIDKFGKCYQLNDPTSETLFDLLPTDGGVINIQGSGSIYKLFPIQNGMLVFASNGIWFITGNQGIGFTATDYTVTKISGEHAISSTSFIDVEGSPIFWNANGIYSVVPGQSYTSGQRGLEVKNLTLPSIKQFYQSIPLSSKLYARGDYNHLTGVIQWLYKSTQETGIVDRYRFDSILNLLTYTEAFYNWTISPGETVISLNFVEYTTSTPTPLFKYLTNTSLNTLTFSEERDNVNWQDWNSSGTLSNYVSQFTTGYRLKGQAQRKFQPQYIYMYSEVPQYGFKIQGIWNYAALLSSNNFSTQQVFNVNRSSSFNKDILRVRIRGNGYVLQFNITSITGKPFNFAGWSVMDTIGIQ